MLYTYSEQQQTLFTKATEAALPTQAKQGCAEVFEFASGWADGKHSSRQSLESSSGASTQPSACQSLQAFAEDASTT